MAKEFDLKIVSIKDLIAYRLDTEIMIKKEVSVRLPTEWGDFEMIAYTQLKYRRKPHGLSKGRMGAGRTILVRVHSSCVTGDIFGSCRCDCGPQLHKAMEMIAKKVKAPLFI
jgi:3,4-dihydroxy 2-butanone 4-phosphate synthase/GTP cyclohydrolase II